MECTFAGKGSSQVIYKSFILFTKLPSFGLKRLLHWKDCAYVLMLKQPHRSEPFLLLGTCTNCSFFCFFFQERGGWRLSLRLCALGAKTKQRKTATFIKDKSETPGHRAGYHETTTLKYQKSQDMRPKIHCIYSLWEICIKLVQDILEHQDTSMSNNSFEHWWRWLRW